MSIATEIKTTAQDIADRFTTGTHALQERTSAFLKAAPPPN
jgi:hypothetical protein